MGYRFFERPKKTEFGVPKNTGWGGGGGKGKNMTEANPWETNFGSNNREFRKAKGSNNQDSTVLYNSLLSDLILLFLLILVLSSVNCLSICNPPQLNFST